CGAAAGHRRARPRRARAAVDRGSAVGALFARTGLAQPAAALRGGLAAGGRRARAAAARRPDAADAQPGQPRRPRACASQASRATRHANPPHGESEMNLQGERLIAAAPEATWAALNDPDTLKACIAGCETLERVADDEYLATMALRIGPVNARFKARLKLENIVPPSSYTIAFD